MDSNEAVSSKIKHENLGWLEKALADPGEKVPAGVELGLVVEPGSEITANCKKKKNTQINI